MAGITFINRIFVNSKGKLALQTFIKGEENYGCWENDIRPLLNNTARDKYNANMNENLKACCKHYGDHDIHKLLELDKYEYRLF